MEEFKVVEVDIRKRSVTEIVEQAIANADMSGIQRRNLIRKAKVEKRKANKLKGKFKN